MMSRWMNAGLLLTTLLTGCAGVAGEDAGNTRGSESEVSSCPAKRAAAFQHAIKAAIAAGDIPGTAVDVTMPGCTWRGAAGFADLDTQAPMRKHSLFRVGSITKTFTAATLLTLVDEGEVSLSAPLSEYVPEYPNAENIVVRQLLNHTSGVYDYVQSDAFWGAVDADVDKVWTPPELLGFATAEPPYFPPGQGWEYASTGFILAGMIIERVTGSTLQAAMQARVLEPLGLEHTYFDTGDGAPPPMPGLVHGYSTYEGTDYDVTDLYSASAAWAAGALVSSAKDVGQLYRSIFEKKFLSHASRAEMTTFVPIDASYFPTCTGYGIALMRCTESIGTMKGHGGSIWGFRSRSFYYAPLHAMVTTLINSESDGVDDVMGAVLGVIEH